MLPMVKRSAAVLGAVVLKVPYVTNGKTVYSGIRCDCA